MPKRITYDRVTVSGTGFKLHIDFTDLGWPKRFEYMGEHDESGTAVGPRGKLFGLLVQFWAALGYPLEKREVDQ